MLLSTTECVSWTNFLQVIYIVVHSWLSVLSSVPGSAMKKHQADPPSPSQKRSSSPGQGPPMPPPRAPSFTPPAPPTATLAGEMQVTLSLSTMTGIFTHLANLQRECIQLRAEHDQYWGLGPLAKHAQIRSSSSGRQCPSPLFHIVACPFGGGLFSGSQPVSSDTLSSLEDLGSISDLLKPQATVVDTASLTINLPGIEVGTNNNQVYIVPVPSSMPSTSGDWGFTVVNRAQNTPLLAYQVAHHHLQLWAPPLRTTLAHPTGCLSQMYGSPAPPIFLAYDKICHLGGTRPCHIL